MLNYTPDIQIQLPSESRRIILDHCRNALEAFQKGETEEGKAFGLIFGTVRNGVLDIANCYALERNVRAQEPYKEYMDSVMTKFAVPSVTPLEKRGWVADPVELFSRIKECRQKNQLLVGTYHMHRVGWDHDSKRDTPTKLDAILAKDSGLIMFIVSMVEPAYPIIRAFYEGLKDREIPVR